MWIRFSPRLTESAVRVGNLNIKQKANHEQTKSQPICPDRRWCARRCRERLRATSQSDHYSGSEPDRDPNSHSLTLSYTESAHWDESCDQPASWPEPDSRSPEVGILATARPTTSWLLGLAHTHTFPDPVRLEV